MTWFILNEDEISGPFEKEHILSICDENSLIWGPGLAEWHNKQDWRTALSRPSAPSLKQSVATPQAVTNKEPEPIPTKEEPTVVAAPTTEPEVKWFYACNKEKFGPFLETELVEMLKMLNFSSQVYIWNKGLDTWAKLEDVPDIIAQVTGDDLNKAA